MADYKAMYYKIYGKVSDIIEELQAVQLQTEAMYVESSEPEIRLLNRDTSDDRQDEK